MPKVIVSKEELNEIALKSLDGIPSIKLLVGYKTKLAINDDGLQKIMPKFEAPSNYKDKDKIEEYLKAKRNSFAAEASNMPYTGTFDSVFIAHPAGESICWVPPDTEGKRPQVASLVVRTWLMKNFPHAWEDDTHSARCKPAVVFVGFSPRAFVKMLGIECSLPCYKKPVPLGLWYNNSDHRDIEEACIPNEYKALLNWGVVFNRRGIKPKATWNGPGQDPVEDVRLIAELSVQLGIIKEKWHQKTMEEEAMTPAT